MLFIGCLNSTVANADTIIPLEYYNDEIGLKTRFLHSDDIADWQCFWGGIDISRACQILTASTLYTSQGESPCWLCLFNQWG